MKTDSYSVILLKAPQNRSTEKSWSVILRKAYLLSKDVLIYFPFSGELVRAVDRILDEIIDRLGTGFLGLRYLLLIIRLKKWVKA